MTEILLITSDFSPRLGGVARYYANLANNFSGLTVLTNVVGEGSQQVIRTSWTWPGWPKWLPLLWLVPYWKLKLKAKWLAAGELLPIGTALMLIKLSFGWRYLVFVHGLDLQLAGCQAWKKWLARQILARASLVIANSNFTRELALTAGARKESTVVVYPGISLAPASSEQVAALKQRYQLQDQRVILTVARLVARKGIDQVLEAIAQIQSQSPKVRLVVVGEGPEREQLEARSTQLQVKVIFTGAVSEEEKSAWYEICELFVLMPRAETVDVEGFGIVYLEAQAASKPIIASKVGGVPEAVGKAGILVDSISELKHILEKLLTSEGLRRKLGEYGRLSVRRDFNPGQQAALLISAVRKMDSR